MADTKTSRSNKNKIDQWFKRQNKCSQNCVLLTTTLGTPNLIGRWSLGLVWLYSYLWKLKHGGGVKTGSKDSLVVAFQIYFLSIRWSFSVVSKWSSKENKLVNIFLVNFHSKFQSNIYFYILFTENYGFREITMMKLI